MSLKRTLAKALIGVALVSSLYGLPTKKANAFEVVMPSGFIIKIPDKTNNKQTNLYKQKQEKHYNWIRPDKYSKWQCAYELIYPRNDKNEEPDGFRIYVDENGDNKPDYTLTYYLVNYGGFFNGVTYHFRLENEGYPVAGGWYNTLKKAQNTCLPEVLRRFFYKRNDTELPPSNFYLKLDDGDIDINTIEATFYVRY